LHKARTDKPVTGSEKNVLVAGLFSYLEYSAVIGKYYLKMFFKESVNNADSLPWYSGDSPV